jgi:hypothetical protein
MEHAKKRREVGYQAVLRGYSEALKPGVSRNYVEHYLEADGAAFNRICCIDGPGAYSDITKIGREDAPWFCSENNIYIAFQFTADKKGFGPSDSPWDALKEITVWPHLENCL